MSQRTGTQRRTWKERALALLLAAVLVAGLAPGLTLPSRAEHWADTYLDQLVDWGVLRADQTADPDAALTRADFMAIINRAYGYTETGPIPFEDVLPTDWFYDDVSIAYTAGYMAGTSDITASPYDSLTREQAVCILGRNMMMQDTPGESLAFSDSRDVSDWARGTVKTAVDNYIISGYPDNTFQPKSAISKAQMAVLITQCVGTPIQQSGSYELGGVFGNVTITAPNVALRNTTISGDLYVSGGVGLGGIRLENVNVLGRIILSGAGESEGGDASVVMRNVTAGEMLVDNMRGRTVTIRADGITEIDKTTVRTSAYLEDNNTDDKGLMNIELDGDSGARLTLAGRIKDVVNKTPNSYIQVAKGTVAKITADEAAVNSTIQLDRNTEVKEMNLDVATNVTGDGDIGQLNVNAPGCVVSMLPDKIYIRPGLTANIAGVVMDSQAAEEGSLDPRLLAGYPAAKDITPEGLRADFAGNKKGTVYWAVSSITDGSIGEDDLISPPSYGSKAIRNGSVAAPVGGDEVSAQITGLSVGGSYYLSAMLVDDQGNRSPVKVVAFTTPDNTVPAFGQGYPYMSYIGKEANAQLITAQVAVMATKNCKMYYTVLPAGAAAPTVDELRSAAISSNLGYGVVDLEKNQVWDSDEAIIVSRRLEEQKDYVLYLWLTDGINSSAVTSLAFSTPDVTPPDFVIHPRSNGDPLATSVPMTAALSENGTIYWVAVKSGDPYPLPNPQNDSDNEEDGKTAKLTSEYAKLQVLNGMGAVSSGRATATANNQVNLNITGLQAETSYDLYYMAVDAAGNYTIQVYKLQGGIRTLDTNPPTVRQFFTKTDSQDPTRPMRDTSIVLEFSENVRLGGTSQDLLSLYEATQEGTTSEQEEALKEFVDALRKNIDFCTLENNEERSVVKDKDGVSSSEWVIDFTKAQVANVNGKIQITFPNTADNEPGLRLASGATYYFKVNIDSQNKISDLSGHEIESSPVWYETPESEGHSLPMFTVVFARVNLTSNGFALNSQQWPLAIEEENNLNRDNNLGIGDYGVDFKFRMRPDSTESVADGIAYDLLLWTDTQLEYDLYYRAVSKSGEALTAKTGTNGSFLYGMPNMPENVDQNGWVKLGSSGVHYIGANSDGRSSKRLHQVFNGCGAGAVLPELNKLSGTYTNENGEKEDVYYEFAVSVRSIGGRTDPNTWGETVNFYVDVAAGDTVNLYGLGESPTNDAWKRFLDNGLTNNGGESIGAAGSECTTGEPRELHMEKTFSDKVQPSFVRGYPTFETTESSVTMNLALTRAGTIYYVIGYAHNGDSDPTSGTWSPTIGTYWKDTGNMIRPEEVPRSGSERDDENPPMPQLKQPTNYQIQDPRGWNEAVDMMKDVPPGSVNCQQVAVQQVTINNLKPNRTYYVYFVITGTDVTPSEVQIYKFKTSPMSRPVITIGSAPGTNGQPGRATLKTDVGSELTYKVYGANSLSSVQYIGDGSLLANYVNPNCAPLPAAYNKLTIYDALQTVYYYNEASKGDPNKIAYYPTDGSGNPENYPEYSVFDVYASKEVKESIKRWLDTAEDESAADKGGPIHLNANVVQNGNPKLQTDQDYYVVAIARKDPIDNSMKDSGVDVLYSFMGRQIKIGDQNPPNLESAIINFTVGDDGTLTSGQITLIFDKTIYKLKGGKDNEITSAKDLFNAGLGGIEEDSVVTSNNNASTAVLRLVTQGKFTSGCIYGTVGTNYLSNSDSVTARAVLDISSAVTTREDATNNYTDYTITVTWTPAAGTGLTPLTETKTVTITKPKTPTNRSAPVATAAYGNVTTSSGSGSIKSGTLTVSFDQALYNTNGSAVTTADLSRIIQSSEGIDLARSSITNDTMNNTARLTLALKQGAKSVSARINSGTLASSSGMVTEEDLIITGTERTSTSGQSNLSVTGYNVDVTWGGETLKTITGTIQ